jgi:hypothetical protein
LQKTQEGLLLGLWDVYPDWVATAGFSKEIVFGLLCSLLSKKQLDFAHSQLDSLQLSHKRAFLQTIILSIFILFKIN